MDHLRRRCPVCHALLRATELLTHITECSGVLGSLGSNGPERNKHVNVRVTLGGPTGHGKTSLLNAWHYVADGVQFPTCDEFRPFPKRNNPDSTFYQPVRTQLWNDNPTLILNVLGTKTHLQLEEVRKQGSAPMGVPCEVYVYAVAAPELAKCVHTSVQAIREQIQGMKSADVPRSQMVVLILKADAQSACDSEYVAALSLVTAMCAHFSIPMMCVSAKTRYNIDLSLQTIAKKGLDARFMKHDGDKKLARWASLVSHARTSDGSVSGIEFNGPWRHTPSATTFFLGMSNFVGRLEAGDLSSKAPRRSLGADIGTQLFDSTYADVVFMVEGKQIYGHKAILCARSATFRNMFTSRAKTEPVPAETNADGAEEGPAERDTADPVEALVAFVIDAVSNPEPSLDTPQSPRDGSSSEAPPSPVGEAGPHPSNSRRTTAATLIQRHYRQRLEAKRECSSSPQLSAVDSDFTSSAIEGGDTESVDTSEVDIESRSVNTMPDASAFDVWVDDRIPNPGNRETTVEFIGSPLDPSKGPQVIRLPAMRQDVFKTMLTYIYTGVVPRLSKSLALRLRPVAELYQLDRLRLVCDLWLDSVNAIIEAQSKILDHLNPFLQWTSLAFEKTYDVYQIVSHARAWMRMLPVPGRVFSNAANYLNRQMSTCDDQALEFIMGSTYKKLKQSFCLLTGKRSDQSDASSNSTDDAVAEAKLIYLRTDWIPAVMSLGLDWYESEEIEPRFLNEDLFHFAGDRSQFFANVEIVVDHSDGPTTMYAQKSVVCSRWKRFPTFLESGDPIVEGPVHIAISPDQKSRETAGIVRINVQGVAVASMQAFLEFTYLGDMRDYDKERALAIDSYCDLLWLSRALGLGEMDKVANERARAYLVLDRATRLLPKLPLDSALAADCVQIFGSAICGGTTIENEKKTDEEKEEEEEEREVRVDWSWAKSVDAVSRCLSQDAALKVLEDMGVERVRAIRSRNGRSLLHFAACSCDESVLSSLVTKYSMDTLERDLGGMTPLHAAVGGGNKEGMTYLLAQTGAPNVEALPELRALAVELCELAVIVDDAATLSQVVQWCKDVSYNATMDDAFSSHYVPESLNLAKIYQLACLFNSSDSISHIVTETASSGWQPACLHFAVHRCSHQALAALLRELDAIDWRNPDNSSALAEWVPRTFTLAWDTGCAISTLYMMMRYLHDAPKSTPSPWDLDLLNVLFRRGSNNPFKRKWKSGTLTLRGRELKGLDNEGGELFSLTLDSSTLLAPDSKVVQVKGRSVFRVKLRHESLGKIKVASLGGTDIFRLTARIRCLAVIDALARKDDGTRRDMLACIARLDELVAAGNAQNCYSHDTTELVSLFPGCLDQLHSY